MARITAVEEQERQVFKIECSSRRTGETGLVKNNSYRRAGETGV